MVFAGVGVLLFVLGWPLAMRRIRPNRWYGLRVPATFASERVWYDANAIAGRDMMVLGVTVILTAIALRYVFSLPEETSALACAALLGVGSFGLAVRGWRLANRMLREEREAR